MRAPSVTPQDEEMHPSGTLQTPTSDTLEAMLQEVSREEQLAAARAIPTHTNVELPDARVELASASVKQPNAGVEQTNAAADTRVAKAGPSSVASLNITPSNVAPPAVENSAPETSSAEATTFVPAPKELMNSVAAQTATRPAARNASQPNDASQSDAVPANVPVSYITEKSSTDLAAARATSAAAIRLSANSQAMRVGERRRLKLLLKTDAPLGLVALTLRLDPRVLAVRSVSGGTLFKPSDAQVTHTSTPEGLLLVTVAANSASSAIRGAGVLLGFEVEALAPGTQGLRFDADDVHIVATDGRKLLLKVLTDEVSVAR